MKIFAPYLLSLLDYASYYNLDASMLKRLLANQNIDINNHEGMVDAEAYLVVFDQVIQLTKNDYSGLYFGSYLNLGALGLVLNISLNTSSIEQGVLILQNFLDNKFPLVSVEVVDDSQNYMLQLDSSVKDSKLKRHLLDMVLSIIYRELKLMLPYPFAPKIRLPYIDDKPYNDSLKLEVTHHSNYQIVLPLEIVNTEINKNKIKEIELLLPKFIAMLNENKEDDKAFSYLIRNMTLNMCSPEIPNFEQVQKQFPYSKRTMQRKLTNEGMSFRGIVNTIKEELSNYLTNEKHLKIKDVAHILGYSESSAYLHAVKSWKHKRN
ncbi:AraC family transcriptional regulator ligand-binding domain-containing protein [Flavivirga amylovorans]|uniref:AraC family transcriptional regulator ligand-binding domain-containing protein n=1 Tax=Flavivirga amylovorans TaxID=870486 RepID=A0ABT8X0N1_9FLAO|nr:AraC family transcriptional regulator ligand-binding domain-containing protein [Flavivirga amylovorans]MDO5987493.1 AraC family transcriptional regulator ligand-binding domain-containing protein [Flavivirga amylovorans]